MATPENQGNLGSKSDRESLQNLDILLDLLSELNQPEKKSSLGEQKNGTNSRYSSSSPNGGNKTNYSSNPIENQKKDNNIVRIREKNLSFTDRKNTNNYFKLENKNNSIYTPQNNTQDWQILLLQQTIRKLENKIENNQDRVDEVIDSVNSLLSLTTEIISLQPDATPQSIINRITPLIDRIIERRSQEDIVRMGEVLSELLPIAIEHQIEATPESIAKALAPEIALSIQEQVRIDRESISKSIGPEMGKAIKAQIELERDAMVDALYPVIGSTIAKYMVEVVNTINEKVENALSIEGIKRKISAKIQGVSEAELILQEAIPYEVQAIFLIHKASGLIIRELQPDLAHQLESDLLAGMLTAMQSFANDLISESSGLDEIDYGEYKIILEVAGYCYLAVVVRGEPSKQFRQKIRKALSKIVLKHSSTIEVYNGDSDTVPEAIKLLLEDLLLQQQKQKKSRSPSPLLILLILTLGAIFIPWSINKHKSYVVNSIIGKTAIALDAAPELSVYHLTPKIEGDKLILTGRVPSEYLRDKAAEKTIKIAEEANLTLENQIISINVPVDPTVAKAEVARVTSILNKQDEIAITSTYQDGVVKITGFSLNQSPDLLAQDFQQIPGVEKIVLNVNNKLPIIEQRIYFASDSIELNSTDFTNTVREIEQLLEMYSELHLSIIGHSDPSGSQENNQKLAKERANKVAQTLIDRGIEENRLEMIGSINLPPGVTSDQPLQESRKVRFEFFIPNNK